jgi:hypothetical protein
MLWESINGKLIKVFENYCAMKRLAGAG